MNSAFDQTDQFSQADFDRLVALSSQTSAPIQPVVQEPTQETTSVAPVVFDNRIIWIAGSLVGIAITAALIGGGLGLASNLSKPKPTENPTIESPEVERAIAKSNYKVEMIDPVPTPSPSPIETPQPQPVVQQITGNATVIVPDGYDYLTARNSDGLEIGAVYTGDRVTVIRDDGDRVVVRTPSFTGSVVRRGIRQD